MRTMGTSEFKAHALEVMKRVAQTREPVVVTKRGAPIVQVAPLPPVPDRSRSGRLAGTGVIVGDIVEPLGEDLWEACR